MRILVANTFVPLRTDAVETLAGRLEIALSERGHQPERIRIPFVGDPETTLEQLVALRLTELSDEGELLVAVGVPAHLLRHRCKVLWMVESAEGWWFPGADREEVGSDRQERWRQDALLAADRLAIGEAQRVFGGSGPACAAIQRRARFVAARLSPPRADRVDAGEWSAVVDGLAGNQR